MGAEGIVTTSENPRIPGTQAQTVTQPSQIAFAVSCIPPQLAW